MRVARQTGHRPPLWVALGLLISATVLVSSPSAAVPPPPPNPSDSDIAAAGAQADARLGEVGALINQVAVVDQQIQHLDDTVARTREQVNKALVDLQNARAAADAAAAYVTATAAELADVGTRIQQARHNFDRFAVAAYTRPASDSVLTYLAPGGPDVALDRAQLLGLTTKNQQHVLDQLHRAQIEQGNKNSAARRAEAAADAAAADAERQQAAAEQAVQTATDELHRHATRRDDLLRSRDDAQARLDAARSRVAGLEQQRDTYSAWDRQRRAEQAALAATASAAAARAAADRAARERAARLGEGTRPHTQLENSPPRSGKVKPLPRAGSDEEGNRGDSGEARTPSVTGAAAVEIVVDRALSQLGVTYAWGGGDEAGPTLGIRDGGVADRHGDYRKVGFDCSGLMVYAFAGIGVLLPHYSGYQYNAGIRVPVSQRARGDMLFWGPGGSRHVALYLGDGAMVEAPESGGVVRVSPVREAGIMPYAVRIVS